MSLKKFTDAYIEAALFSTNDESDETGGVPLDKNYGPEDIAPATLAGMKRDCEKFYSDFEGLWTGQFLGSGDEDEQAGYDFWMTRNGHGVGFWEDDDWEEEAGKKLTAGAKKFGSFDLYVGDDGEIHGSPLRSNKRGSRRSSRPNAEIANGQSVELLKHPKYWGSKGVVHARRLVDDGGEGGMRPCYQVIFIDPKGKSRSTWAFADELRVLPSSNSSKRGSRSPKRGSRRAR